MSRSSISDLAALTEEALGQLVSLPGTLRALVLTREDGHPPLVRRQHGEFAPEELDPQQSPCGYLLRLAAEQARSVHSVDLAQDPAFGACPRREVVRSALCVPVLEEENVVGLLYADHPTQAGAFSYAERRRLEEFASGLGAALAAARLPGEEPARHPHGRLLGMAAGLFALALLWGGAGFLRGMLVKPPPPPPPVTVESASPEVVASSYLAMVRLKQYSGAYRLISAERRRSLSLDQFRERAARWLADSDMSWQLAHRRVGAATLKGDSCNVTVAPVARGRPWVVRLKREGEAWKLSRVGFRQRH